MSDPALMLCGAATIIGAVCMTFEVWGGAVLCFVVAMWFADVSRGRR